MSPEATDRTRRGARARTTRRGFLALAASAGLAGCNGFGYFSDDRGPTVEGAALSEVASTDPPTVTERFPVEVEQSYLDEAAATAREHLSAVPAPLDESDVPNGVIRQEVSRLYEEANEALADAAEATTTADAMGRLRDAREDARAAAAAWAAIDGDLDREAVRASIPTVRRALEEFQFRWRYVGQAPVRAVLAHAQIEERVGFAGRRLRGAGEHHRRYRRRPDNPLAIGEFAGEVESARAAIDDAAYVYDRYVASLGDPRPIGEGLRAVGESLVETLDERREALPGEPHAEASSLVDRDVEGTPIAEALTGLRDAEYADGLDDELATGRRASVVLSVHDTLAQVRAFERLRERVADGEFVRVETIEDVRTIRDAAVDAVAAAADSERHSRLDRRLLASLGDFGYADRQIEEYADRDQVPVDWLVPDLSYYVAIEARAREVPAASATVAEAIGSEL
ncbi:hypothetical protein [Halorussus marinus]|uniref:hypothetical protein n=1 Tax=Halorussus marinus TaxID=2505976 RepID=UPI00106E9CB3|nr:hypothetical protein [Halorussus marinus]